MIRLDACTGRPALSALTGSSEEADQSLKPWERDCGSLIPVRALRLAGAATSLWTSHRDLPNALRSLCHLRMALPDSQHGNRLGSKATRVT